MTQSNAALALDPEAMSDTELADAIEASVKAIDDRVGRMERLLRAAELYLNQKAWTRASGEEWTRLTGLAEATPEDLIRLIRKELGEPV